MTGVPYLTRAAKNALGRSGRLSEKRLAKSLGGRAQPASGALEGAKGDIKIGRVLMEAKSTIAASMALQLDWLAKISAEARSDGSTPALAVSFVTPDGRPRMDGDWVLIPLHRYKELL